MKTLQRLGYKFVDVGFVFLSIVGYLMTGKQKKKMNKEIDYQVKFRK